MAIEQYANNTKTSLTNVGGISAGALSLTVAAWTGPTVGNFRILIDTEILIVTAVSGLTLTVTRGAEGTTAAAHPFGSAVTHILTSASVLNLISESHASGPSASIPAAGRAGRLYYCTDSGQVFRDSGSAWVALKPRSRVFSAATDCIVPAVGTPHFGSVWSFSAWVKILKSGVQHAIWSRWTSSVSAREMYLYIKGDLTLQVDIPFIAAIGNSSTAITKGLWQHIGVTRNGSSWAIYINGIVGASPSSSAVSETGPAPTIGFSVSSADPIQGSVAQFCNWSTALTAAQMLQLAGGANPADVDGANRTFFMPVYGDSSPEPDLISGNDGVVTGTLAAAGPF